MKRIAKVAAVATAGLGLIVGAAPAQAIACGTASQCHAGVVAFVGTATTTPNPPFPPTQGTNGTWSLTNNTGSDTGVGVNTEGAAGIATVSVSGDLHVGIVNVFGPGPNTGLSGGSDGEGFIKIGTSPDLCVEDVGWPQSAATVIVFSGDTLVRDATVACPLNTKGKGGGLAGVVSALPVPGGGTFTVIGVGGATYTV